MRRFLKQCGPWMGSAIVHAVALVLLAIWLVVLPRGRGPLSADFGDAQEATVPSLLQDELLQSAEAFLPESNEALDEALPSFSLTDPSSLKLAGPSNAGSSLDERLTELVGGNDGRSATFFGTMAEGERFVFILDISGSMEEGDDHSETGNSRFTRARQELLATISHLYPGQEFAVLLFSSSCRPMFELPANRVTFFEASKGNKSRITKWLHRVVPGGATDPRSSLQVALALYPDAIFLLSDGEFRTGRDGDLAAKVLRQVKQLNRRDIPIHTVAFQDRRSRKALRALSEQNFGTFRFVE